MVDTPSRTPVVARLRSAAVVMGPAFVIAVAYVDPGNFATNMAGGAAHGHLLLWVVVGASALAMFVQYQSAKLGVVTGRNLPELCREHYSRPVTGLLWAQAELVAMATDLAEFVGAAVALNLLFGVPLLPAALITAVVSAGILALAPLRRRRFESVIVGLLAVVLGGFLYQALRLGPPTGAAAGLVPGFAGVDSVLLATGMLGATVMPHVIYLHSALTQRHHTTDPAARRRVLRASRADIVVALGVAGAVNASMLIVAAGAFHGSGPARESLEDMHAGLGALLGPGAALAFALALLASGLAASSVGTYSGQVVMEGFLRRRIPMVLRRLLTMLPALAVLALGVDPTQALVLSQVVLSFGIPFALVPLVLLGRRADVMGSAVNRRGTTLFGVAGAVVISALNLFLLVRTLTG
ncbi:Nramp family divalent metal transporter [Actinosynnema sp. NPDC047251]|uniref:Mn2+/Fe2+ transporter, NRAMP family n=1 Tax=Saccharothrix espanaensis (strain ATCC 51144 / DSM 44229 / JCM 9112 / NBRC 15066 / NRRL 15764) TaxID=1179773 RepID=K0K6U2_SACES|nr:Nramp family divalent metal transporter [Saccharothrix espanaensis]CCH32589.1 Mn2+/Fe2+ transporter, NRAMP family [Saccharothrix espanaensis DSM 44229]